MTDLGPATSAELATATPRWLLIPLGSTEQHGAHLPLDTDTRVATAWARGVADHLDSATVAPALPYGSSGEHQAFPGTLSIGQDALHHLLVELVRSASHRFEAVALLSGHAGNHQPVTEAAAQLRGEGRLVIALFPSWSSELWPEGSIDAHAGRTETSLLLHLAPQTVRAGLARAGVTTPVGQLIDRLRSDGVAGVAPNGVLGDPTEATAEEGARLLSDLVGRTVEILRASEVAIAEAVASSGPEG